MNVFDYIKHEEQNYKTDRVIVADGYDWNMYEHIRLCTLFRDSKFSTGPNDYTRPFKNIIRRIITLQHFATGFDVKDIEPFVNDVKDDYKSLLIRKFHPGWARKHNIDTFIDETVESYVDFGLALSKHVNQIRPENVQLQSIAFCDQTDILSGPICIKHQYSPAQLHEFDGKWRNIEEVITLARKEKVDPQGVSTKTPGKFIEVYELDGMFPADWQRNEETTEDAEGKYTQQLHIVTFYKDEKGSLKGIPLFQGKGDPNKYKAIKRDPVFGRACGFGGIEELIQSQLWTNYDEIRIQGMLDAISKVLGITDDPTFANRNKITDMENGQWLTVADGKKAEILNNRAPSLDLFRDASDRWEQHAQAIGSANDALLGETPTAGTPFKLQDLLTQQGKGPHEYRQGKVATYIAEIYRDWLLKDFSRELSKPQTFKEELSLDELQYVHDCVVTCLTNQKKIETILNTPIGTTIDPAIFDQYQQQVSDEFKKKGNKHFFDILAGEMKNIPVDVEMNIAGKQKNLSQMADKLTNIFRTIMVNPAILQDKGMADLFNQIIESSGLDTVDFSGLEKVLAKQAAQQAQPAPSQFAPPAAPNAPALAMAGAP